MSAGIFIKNGIVNLSGTSIRENYSVHRGGGLTIFDNSQVTFDPVNRCSIYNNFACTGLEVLVETLYFNNLEVIVDTFTIINPTTYFAQYYLPENFSYSFDINHHVLDQIDNDLYVSPNGNDNNSGLTSNDPLKTINYAVRLIKSNSTNPKTIFLESGVYSKTGNQQLFALTCKSHVNIIGENMINTIIDGENNDYSLMHIGPWSINSTIKNLTFQNSDCFVPVFLFSRSDDITIENVTVRNCDITGHSTGIKSTQAGGDVEITNVTVENVVNAERGMSGAWFSGTTSISASNCTFSNNNCTASTGFSAGLYAMSNGDIIVENCKFINNTVTSTTWSGYASALLITNYNDVMGNSHIHNNLFVNNQINNGKGTFYAGSVPTSFVNFTNNTVIDNVSSYGICFKGNMYCQNNILRNPGNYEIGVFYDTFFQVPSYLYASYNNIEGGENAVYNDYGGMNYVFWEEGNIDEDPLFLLSGDDPYQLTELSPCIDAGTPDTTGLYLPPWDFLYNQRVWDGDGDGIAIIDMGCYEYGSSYASGFISGFVIDTSGNLLENAEITAGNFTTFSNENGEYDLEAIVGTYDVICYLEDYEVSVMENVVVILGETTTVNFMLDPAVNTNDVLNPKDIQLTNYPNPFNPDTRIVFGLPEAGRVEVIIYNIKGQKVKTLMDCTTAPGQYNCIWDGRNAGGKRVSSGEYIVKLKVNGEEKAVRKMLLLR